MTGTPERIWAWGHPRDVCSIGEWQDLPCDHTEYVRADLATPLDDPRVKALAEAGKAVVDHWDSPLWKDLPHTGESIDELRAALSALEENK